MDFKVSLDLWASGGILKANAVMDWGILQNHNYENLGQSNVRSKWLIGSVCPSPAPHYTVIMQSGKLYKFHIFCQSQVWEWSNDQCLYIATCYNII